MVAICPSFPEFTPVVRVQEMVDSIVLGFTEVYCEPARLLHKPRCDAAERRRFEL